MSNRCPRPLAALTAVVCLAISVRAQLNEVPNLKGEVRANTPVNYADYRIELEDLNRHGEIYRVDLRLDGDFELRHVLAGEYQLRVTGQHGDVIQQEFVTINAMLPTISVRLSLPRKTPSAPGTISMKQLRHPPNPKAIQSFAAAQRLAASGSPEKAVEELEKAVRISPEFADAYTNLAVQHIRMQHFDEAAGELARAIDIAGPDALRLSNLAYVQMNLGRVREALLSVRAALRLNSGYAQAHLILGSILASSRGTLSEAIPHLELAAETLPAAVPALARARNQLQQAATQ